MWSPARAANLWTLVIGTLAIALSPHTAAGQDPSRYRTFELGASMASVLSATTVAETRVTTLHERPALLQELEWRPSRWATGSQAASTDPVDQVRFSFYEHQLYRMVINYGHERTGGLTDADLVEAISTMYGSPLTPSAAPAGRDRSGFDRESGAIVAQWGDADHAVTLHRITTYGNTWRLIVTKTSLETLARKAQQEAERLDVIDAPQKEIDRQIVERERERAAAEKARELNSLRSARDVRDRRVWTAPLRFSRGERP